MKIIKYLKLLTFLGVISVLVIISATFQPLQAYYTNMPASVVVGQSDFTSGVANQNGSSQAYTLNNPSDVYSDGQHLFVSDSSNNRVLVWNHLPTEHNATADIVIGQPDFVSNLANQGSTPQANTLKEPFIGMRVHGGKLFISDTANHRILIFNQIPTSNDASADVVIGQTGFASGLSNQGGSVKANTLYQPAGMFVDSESRLIVADRLNHRVLIFNQVPTSNDASADVVIGQQNFISRSANQGGSVKANTLNEPADVFVNNGKLFVADRSNHRVLIFNQVPTSNDASADVVIGQQNFNSGSINQGTTVGPSTMYRPHSIYVDNTRLFVADYYNHRVLIFNSIPATNGASADVVIGQASLTLNAPNTSGLPLANTLRYVPDIHIAGNNLYVADYHNHRVLIFDNVIATPGLNIDQNPEALSDGRYKLKGNIVLGERSRYSMQWVKVSVNGEGFGNVTSLSGGRDDGPGTTRYDFYHEFPPWVRIDGIDKSSWNADIGYTLKVKASSFNADDTTVFFFTPFKLISFTDGVVQTVKFSVPAKHVQRVKDGVDHFEVWVKKESSEWSEYVSDISTDRIGSDTGEVAYTKVNTLPKGKYEIKVVAVSKESSWRQDSSSLTQEVSGASFNNPLNLPVTTSFPLQINKITGVNSGNLSTFNISAIKQSYSAATLKPTITGISYAFSEINLIVTDNKTGEYKTYKTTVNPDSSFIISPTLFSSSIIDISSYHSLTGQFNLLPSITLTLSGPSPAP